MAPSPNVRPYPYGALLRLRRRTIRSEVGLRRQLADEGLVERVASALLELIGSPIGIESVTVGGPQLPPSPHVARLAIDFGPPRGRVVLEVDPRLVVQVVAPFIERPRGLQNPLESLDVSLVGAFAAVVASVLEVAMGHVPFSISDATPWRGLAHRPLPPDALAITAVVRIAGMAHGVTLRVPPDRNYGPAPLPRLDQRAWGHLPVPVPLVIGCMLGMPEELTRMKVGAAWLMGDSLWTGREMAGFVVLAPPLSELGWGGRLVEGGQIVLGEGTVTLPSLDENPTGSDEFSQSLSDIVARAPVVVRIELGSVTLSAEQWGQLRPGDTLETRIPLGRPVDLRAGGQVVAQGELVDVDGEVGVQIRRLGGGSSR